MIASLLCHDDIKICRVCIGWLRGRAGGIDVTPTLPVADMGQAIEFYEKNLKDLGYKVRAEILSYPDGNLGEVGVYLRW